MLPQLSWARTAAAHLRRLQDFERWASEYALNRSETARLAAIYSDERVRDNLTVRGTKWYWAQVHHPPSMHCRTQHQP